MEDSRPLAIGRVRWFDAARQKGLIIDVGGGRHQLNGEYADPLPPLSPGQLVTFRAVDGRSIAHIRPVGAA